jgi:hypothetical protein
VAEAPGEFTRVFHPPSAPARPPSSAAPGGLVADAPGEFTRLFDGPPAGPKKEGISADAGEFTRVFPQPPPVAPKRPAAEPPSTSPPAAQVGAVPPASGRGPFWAPPPPDAGSAETGQFTRLFGSRLPGEAIDIEKEHASAARSAAPENRPFQAAGEFTRMFGPQGMPGASMPSASALPEGDLPPSLNTSTRLTSASGMFGSPEQMAQIAASALPGGAQPDSGPGEYTRLFDSPKPSAEPALPAPPAAPPPEAALPRKSRRNLVVIVVSVAVLVTLIVVAIVLRKG